jgi:ABC-2 type transport system permease protein
MAGRPLRLLGAYLRHNLGAALEYRGSLVSQALGMVLNNLLWVSFWTIFFAKFPVLAGWTLTDVLVLWAVMTTSVGLVFGLFANSLRLSAIISEGQLDYYLTLPGDALTHVLVSAVRPLHLGDLVFGPVLLLVAVGPDPVRFAVFCAVVVLSAAVMLGFLVILGSLAFFLGSSEAVATQAVFALKTFAYYPADLFGPRVRALLYTVLPAALVTTVPVELVREFRLEWFLALVAGALAFMGLGVALFRLGLRRYESGHSLQLRA